MRGGAALKDLGTRALHRLARIALCVQSPLGARRTVRVAAVALPPFGSLEEARAAGRMLEKHGTCLTRSLAVAARLPGSQVVIGVDARGSSDMLAHAWVQLGSEVVYPVPAKMQNDIVAVF